MGVGVAVGSGGSPLPQAATNSAQKATTRGRRLDPGNLDHFRPGAVGASRLTDRSSPA